MPEVKAPLLSLSAKGTLGRQLTFQGFPGGTRAIEVPLHPDTFTYSQLIQRLRFLNATDYWRSLSVDEKTAYRSAASGLNITGYNLCVRQVLSGDIDAGCVLLLPMLDGAGPTCLDISTYANHGTIFGATWVTQPSGKHLLTFDAVNDHVDVAHHASLDLTGPLTIEAIYRLTSWSATGWPIMLCKGDLTDSYFMRYQQVPPTTTVGSQVNGVGSVSTGGFTHDTFWHVLASYDPVATTFTLYRNGYMVRERNRAGVGDTTPRDLHIGSHHTAGNPFGGEIFCVRLLSRATSAAAALARFKSLQRLFPAILQ